MVTSQEATFSAPRLFIFVTKVEDEKKLEEALDALHVPICYQCRGKGTAPKMLDIFGLSGTTRLITIGILPKFMIQELFNEVGKVLPFQQRGGGIGFTIPITGLQNPMFQMLNDEARTDLENRIKERIEKDMSEIREKSDHTVLWISVANGYSDDVVDAAKAAGAKGGTILKGLRHNSERVSQHFGISMQEEQDFVMIVVSKEKKAQIMSAICSACGLKTPAHGFILALPVEDAIGLQE